MFDEKQEEFHKGRERQLAKLLAALVAITILCGLFALVGSSGSSTTVSASNGAQGVCFGICIGVGGK